MARLHTNQLTKEAGTDIIGNIPVILGTKSKFNVSKATCNETMKQCWPQTTLTDANHAMAAPVRMMVINHIGLPSHIRVVCWLQVANHTLIAHPHYILSQQPSPGGIQHTGMCAGCQRWMFYYPECHYG